MPDQFDAEAARIVMDYYDKRCWGYDPVEHREYEGLMATALRTAAAQAAPRTFAALREINGETDWDHCDKCGGVFPDEKIQPTGVAEYHEHWCVFCIKATQAAAESARKTWLEASNIADYTAAHSDVEAVVEAIRTLGDQFYAKAAESAPEPLSPNPQLQGNTEGI